MLPAGAPVVRGTPNVGGSIITAAGLMFIASTMDDYLCAFDIDTGAELWKGRLPAGAHAMPMTYRLRPGGKQYGGSIVTVTTACWHRTHRCAPP